MRSADVPPQTARQTWASTNFARRLNVFRKAGARGCTVLWAAVTKRFRLRSAERVLSCDTVSEMNVLNIDDIVADFNS